MTYYPANRRYEQKNIVAVKVNFNRKTESDLVKRIEQQENKAGYLKRLVKEDIERESGKD